MKTSINADAEAYCYGESSFKTPTIEFFKKW